MDLYEHVGVNSYLVSWCVCVFGDKAKMSLNHGCSSCITFLRSFHFRRQSRLISNAFLSKNISAQNFVEMEKLVEKTTSSVIWPIYFSNLERPSASSKSESLFRVCIQRVINPMQHQNAHFFLKVIWTQSALVSTTTCVKTETTGESGII